MIKILSSPWGKKRSSWGGGNTSCLPLSKLLVLLKEYVNIRILEYVEINQGLVLPYNSRIRCVCVCMCSYTVNAHIQIVNETGSNWKNTRKQPTFQLSLKSNFGLPYNKLREWRQRCVCVEAGSECQEHAAKRSGWSRFLLAAGFQMYDRGGCVEILGSLAATAEISACSPG